MFVHRNRHAHGFTTMPNGILRHPRLSLTARGLLGHLLSLPDGSRETIQTVAEKVSEGRLRVRKAMAELEAEGYVRRVRQQDPETGTWTTAVHVSDLPVTEVPSDRILTVGSPAGRAVGRSPKGVKNPGEEPSPKRVAPKAAEKAAETAEGGRGDAPQTETAPTAEIGRAAAMLGRLGAYEAKLSLSAADCLSLAPLAARWLDRGVSELEIRNVLAAGLPASVHAPAKLVANRLERKLPAPRKTVEAVALAECAECGLPLPRGQRAGICGRCAGVAVPADSPSDVTDWRSSLRRSGVIAPSLGRAKVRAALSRA
ncbi:hypothetical protein [Streptomyces sp. NPDC001380]|uniref:hypothetical protein n=1 Tax=Streptomyces sp. NPDC001380 TaxID=3364566 RepID=UPI0036A4841B